MSKLLQLTATLALAAILVGDVDARGSHSGGAARGASHKSAGAGRSAGSARSASKSGAAGKNASHSGAAKNGGSAANRGAGHAGSRNGTSGRAGARGAGYRGWSSWGWNSGFGCYLYWSPYDNSYYYWYNPGMMYLPVADIQQFPPVPMEYAPAAPGIPPMPLAQASRPIP